MDKEQLLRESIKRLLSVLEIDDLNDSDVDKIDIEVLQNCLTLLKGELLKQKTQARAPYLSPALIPTPPPPPPSSPAVFAIEDGVTVAAPKKVMQPTSSSVHENTYRDALLSRLQQVNAALQSESSHDKPLSSATFKRELITSFIETERKMKQKRVAQERANPEMFAQLSDEFVKGLRDLKSQLRKAPPLPVPTATEIEQERLLTQKLALAMEIEDVVQSFVLLECDAETGVEVHQQSGRCTII